MNFGEQNGAPAIHAAAQGCPEFALGDDDFLCSAPWGSEFGRQSAVSLSNDLLGMFFPRSDRIIERFALERSHKLSGSRIVRDG